MKAKIVDDIAARRSKPPENAGGRDQAHPIGRLATASASVVTGNLAGADDPACLFVDGSAPEATAAGLSRDCLISCYLWTLMSEDRLRERIGRLSAAMQAKLDKCLKAALGTP